MNKQKSNTQLYERTDFSNVMKTQKAKKIVPPIKRITINISERIYQEANELDIYLGMGYQNVLKTAMTLGLSALYNEVSSHKITEK
jgi:hypothetical protein